MKFPDWYLIFLTYINIKILIQALAKSFFTSPEVHSQKFSKLNTEGLIDIINTLNVFKFLIYSFPQDEISNLGKLQHFIGTVRRIEKY